MTTNIDAHFLVDKTIVEPGLIVWLEQHHDRLLAEVLAYHDVLDPMRPAGSGRKGRKKRRPGHNLALQLQDFKVETLRFLYDAGVPSTNNQAERDLRLMKQRMKISGASSSERCAQGFATLRSVLSTARKRGRSGAVATAMRTAGRGYPSWRAAPQHDACCSSHHFAEIIDMRRCRCAMLEPLSSMRAESASRGHLSS